MESVNALRAADDDAGEIAYAPERDDERAAVDALIDRAFGPGRYAKTAERLREGRLPAPGLSLCARSEEGAAIGAVRLWTVRIGGRPAIFLGPIAVEAVWRSHGVGAALVQRACAAAAENGHGLVLLVGDPPFFGPLGFSSVPPGRVVMPGPVSPARVLWRPLAPGALDGVCGVVTPQRR